jgi:hypothetical protein
VTTPGSQGAQQAYQQQVRQTSAAFHRNAAYQDQRRRPVGFLFSLLFALVAVGIFLTIIGQSL